MSKELPRYRVNAKSYIGHSLVDEGAEVFYDAGDGSIGENLSPLNEAAQAVIDAQKDPHPDKSPDAAFPNPAEGADVAAISAELEAVKAQLAQAQADLAKAKADKKTAKAKDAAPPPADAPPADAPPADAPPADAPPADGTVDDQV